MAGQLWAPFWKQHLLPLPALPLLSPGEPTPSACSFHGVHSSCPTWTAVISSFVCSFFQPFIHSCNRYLLGTYCLLGLLWAENRS